MEAYTLHKFPTAGFIIIIFCTAFSGCVPYYRYDDANDIRPFPAAKTLDTLILGDTRPLSILTDPDTCLIITDWANDDTLRLRKLDRNFRTIWSTMIAEGSDSDSKFGSTYIMGKNILCTKESYTNSNDSIEISGTLYDGSSGKIISTKILAKDVRLHRGLRRLITHRILHSDKGNIIVVYRGDRHDAEWFPDTMSTYMYGQNLELISKRTLNPGFELTESARKWRNFLLDGYGNVYEINCLEPSTVTITRHDYREGTSRTLSTHVSDIDFSDANPDQSSIILRFITPKRLHLAIMKDRNIGLFTRRNWLYGVGVLEYDFDHNTVSDIVNYTVNDSVALKLTNDDIITSVRLKDYRPLTASMSGHLFIFEGYDTKGFNSVGSSSRGSLSESSFPSAETYVRSGIIIFAFDGTGRSLWQRPMPKEQHSDIVPADLSFTANYTDDHISIVYAAERGNSIARAVFPLDGLPLPIRDRIFDISPNNFFFPNKKLLYADETIWLSDEDIIILIHDSWANEWVLNRISIPLGR